MFRQEPSGLSQVSQVVCVSVCVRVNVCLPQCVSVASHTPETIETIAIKFDKVTASVTTMLHILNIWAYVTQSSTGV